MDEKSDKDQKSQWAEMQELADKSRAFLNRYGNVIDYMNASIEEAKSKGIEPKFRNYTPEEYIARRYWYSKLPSIYDEPSEEELYLFMIEEAFKPPLPENFESLPYMKKHAIVIERNTNSEWSKMTDEYIHYKPPILKVEKDYKDITSNAHATVASFYDTYKHIWMERYGLTEIEYHAVFLAVREWLIDSYRGLG